MEHLSLLPGDLSTHLQLLKDKLQGSLSRVNEVVHKMLHGSISKISITSISKTTIKQGSIRLSLGEILNEEVEGE